jgi:hypothetical protein
MQSYFPPAIPFSLPQQLAAFAIQDLEIPIELLILEE